MQMFNNSLLLAIPFYKFPPQCQKLVNRQTDLTFFFYFPQEMRILIDFKSFFNVRRSELIFYYSISRIVELCQTY